MICSTKRRGRWRVIKGEIIKRVNSTKSLGVDIDDLSWRKHIEKISKKIASAIGALKRTYEIVCLRQYTSIYLSPNCSTAPWLYCCTVWDNCSNHIQKLQKLQNHAARILTYSTYDTNADILLEKLGWKKLDFQHKIQTAVMVFKSFHGLAPNYLRSVFTNRDSVTSYTLRDTEGKLAVTRPRTNYLKNSFSYSGAVLWNISLFFVKPITLSI